MHLATFLTYVAVDTVLCFVPGLAVMTVIGAALSRRTSGFGAAFGILTGNALYFVTSALGIVSLIAASHVAFLALKWCGTAYSAYIGIRALAMPRVKHPVVEPAAGSAPGVVRSWLSGTIAQLANPKALVFFTAIVPQFVNPSAVVTPQLVVLGVASLVIELAVLSIYVSAIDLIRTRGLTPVAQVWIERIGGACLIGVATAVAFESAA